MSFNASQKRVRQKIELLRQQADIGAPRMAALPHQLPMLLAPARFKLIRCGRRWGKTVAALIALIYGHGPDGSLRGIMHGVDGVWLSPDYQQARAVWRILMQLFRGLPGVEVFKSELTIRFPNGATLEIRSAENIDSIRGRSFGCAVIDEAAFLDFEYAYQSVIRPALADVRGWAIVISTPKVGSFFNDLCARALTEQGAWATFVGPTRENSALDPDEIAELYAGYPPGSTDLRQELEAELITSQGDLFDLSLHQHYDEADLDSLTIAGVSLPLVERRLYVDLAASLRQKADFTVVLVAGLTPRIGGRRKLAVLHIERRKIEGPDQIRLIREMVDVYHPSVVKVEAVGYALTMVQALKREITTRVEPLNPDKDKRSRAIPAASALARGDILLPRSAPWLQELHAELIAFPNGRHDDQVDALAYAAADLVYSKSIRTSCINARAFPVSNPFDGHEIDMGIGLEIPTVFPLFPNI